MLPGLRAAVDDAQAKAAATRRRKAAAWEPAATDPVARVLVDIALAHLDRPFDYAVPAAMADTAVPGARVKVRFAGQDVDGFVVERAASTDHTGTLQPLRRVVSPEPVLAPEIAELSATLAHRYAGARSDVLRLAVPPRHATTEKQPSPPAPPARRRRAGAWAEVEHADAFLRRLAAGESPRAVWSRRARGRLARDGRRGRRDDVRRRARARWSASPTVATSPASTPRSARLLGEGHHVVPHRRRRARGALPRLPGGLPRARASSSAPASAAFAPCTTSAWWCSGTTATTCTPSPARPTPTPARCWWPAPSSSRPRCCSAASPAPPRSSSWSRPAGPTSSPCRGRAATPGPGRGGAGGGPARSAPASRAPAYDAIRRGLVGPGPGADAARGLRRLAGVRHLPHPGPLHRRAPVRWWSGPAVPPAVPLVRPRRGVLGVRAPAGARPARPGARARPARPRSWAGCSPAPRSAARAASGWSTASVPRRHRGGDVGAEPVAEEGYAAVVVLDTWLTLARDDMSNT